MPAPFADEERLALFLAEVAWAPAQRRLIIRGGSDSWARIVVRVGQALSVPHPHVIILC
jgi:hypothetical protein